MLLEFDLGPAKSGRAEAITEPGKVRQRLRSGDYSATRDGHNSGQAGGLTPEGRVSLLSRKDASETEEPLPESSAGEFVELGPTEEEPEKAIRQGMLLEGKKEGLWRVLAEPGVVWMEVEYHQGLRHGTERVFDAGGQVRSEKEYREDVLEGEVRYWHSNGVLAIESHYVEGVLSGEYRQWSSRGVLSRHLTYANGELEGRCVWFDQAGRVDVVKSGFYSDGRRERPLE